MGARWACLFGAVAWLAASPVRAEPSVRVNEASLPVGNATVAPQPSGGFVAVWDREYGAGPILGRLFDADLTPLGSAFSVNPDPVAYYPAVAAGPGGEFVVVWGVETDIVARRFDTTGAPLSGVFQVNTYTTGQQHFSAVAAMPSGDFVVTWVSDGQDGDQDGVFAQRFDTGGLPLGGEFQVNTWTTGRQYFPGIAADPGGGFLIVWGNSGQRYDGGGMAIGGEFEVVAATTLARRPTAAINDDGGFIVAWESPDGASSGIFARAFDPSGAPLGPHFRVNAETSGSQVSAMAAADGTRFLVLWTDGDASAGLGHLYDGTGSALGSPFQVHKGGLFQRITGAARGTSDGEFLVALTEHGIPEDEDDVFVRRLRPGRILGNRCVLRATAGGTRKVVCSAKERLSPSFVVGDPVGGGATLRVVTTGGTPADQTFALPAVRWSAVGAGPQGYRYADPAGADGPVRSVRVQRRSSQTFTLTATITGTSPGVQLVPPNPGESVVMALQLAGGETYCAGFGLGQGGGTISPNDATAFQVRRPITAGSCPP